MKEEIFSKFKDYNKELEKILEKKDFSKDTKNLLLSMFYKLEMSYNDYFTVKRKSKTKQEYLENILENIKNSHEIELVKPSDEKFEKFKENGLYTIDLKLKKIKVIANELALLSALLELNNFAIHLNEEYNLIRNSMPYLLNMAYDMENVEVLRDFNAWSWNTLVSEIKNISINLIYQNLKIAINQNIFNILQQQNSYIDVVAFVYQELLKLYPEKTVDKFMEHIFKLSILIYLPISENETKRLREEKETLEIELNEIKDKKGYIEKVTNQKKELTSRLKSLDLIMNNKELLLEEYTRRNEKLSEYNKIFSISHLVEKMQKERKRTLEKIEICNQDIEPQTYLSNKNKLQKDFNLLKDIDFEKENEVEKELNKLQKLFIDDIFLSKIENAKERNEIIDCVYELRYYCFLPYTEEKTIEDIKNLRNGLQIAKEQLIKKLYDYKLINTISSNEKNDIEIIKNIFTLKMINLEDVYLEVKKKEKKFIIQIYDEKETLEKEIEMELEFNKKDKVKLNRKVKLFN